MSGLEAYNDAGFLQFSSDHTYQIRLVSKGLVMLGDPITYSGGGSATITVPAGVTSPILALRCTSAIAPFLSYHNSDGSYTFYCNSGGAKGGTCAYYLFDGAPSTTSTTGAGLEVYRADGSLCFSSNIGFFNVAAIVSNNQSVGLVPGRLYASFVPAFSGSLQQSGDSDYANANTRYHQVTGQQAAFVNLGQGVAGVTNISWSDSNSAPYHAPINMPNPPVMILDVTSFGTIAGEVTYGVSMSPTTASAAQVSTANYTFPAETVAISGSASVSGYSWSIVSPVGGTWSIASGQGTASAQAAVTGVAEATNATATIQCVVTGNGTQQTTSAYLAYNNKPNPNAVSVSMSPGDQGVSYGGNANPTYIFSQESITVANASASSYSWSLSNISGGSWSISSGQGTANATITISSTSPGNSYLATLTCTVVVNGTTYTKTANYNFYNSYQGGGGGGGNLN